MTGKWRIGGYAGIGSSSISTITNVQLYVDLAETGYNGETAVDYYVNFDPTI